MENTDTKEANPAPLIPRYVSLACGRMEMSACGALLT